MNTKSRALIAFFDDDKMFNQPYLRTLDEAGFSILYAPNPDEAWKNIQSQGQSISLFIIDVMMPPGEKYSSVSTRGGLVTGILLCEGVRNLFPTVPIIILTNVANQETLRQIPTGALLRIAKKKACPPADLVALVREMLKPGKGPVPAGQSDDAL